MLPEKVRSSILRATIILFLSFCSLIIPWFTSIVEGGALRFLEMGVIFLVGGHLGLGRNLDARQANEGGGCQGEILHYIYTIKFLLH